MIPYIVAFFTAYLFVYTAETYFKNKNKAITFFLLGLACISLSLLAAFRDEHIGTDVLAYVKRYFSVAVQADSFQTYAGMFERESVEVLYRLLNYITARITDNVRVMYFLIEFWDVAFIAAFLWENREKASITMGFFVYTMLLFNLSLNIVRQVMALCVCLYSFNAARDKKIIKFIALMTVAVLTHRSTALMIVTYPLMRLFEKKTFQRKNMAIAFYALIITALLCFINEMVSFMINIGIFPIKLSIYIGNGFGVSRFSVFVFALPALLILLYFEKKLFRLDESNSVMFLYIVLWLVFAQLDSVSNQFGRLAYGFMLANIPIYSQLPRIRNVSNNMVTIRNIRIIMALSVVFWAFYWFINFVVWKTADTIPYKFGL